MKLSEILGWRKKDKIHLLFNGRYSQVALETALTSCDREIDREALAKALFVVKQTLLQDEDIVIDNFISTMPTWLKPTERK